MYHVSAQGVDECMRNVHYYYYKVGRGEVMGGGGVLYNIYTYISNVVGKFTSEKCDSITCVIFIKQSLIV